MSLGDPWLELLIVASTIIGLAVIAYVFITDEMGGPDGGGY